MSDLELKVDDWLSFKTIIDNGVDVIPDEDYDDEVDEGDLEFLKRKKQNEQEEFFDFYDYSSRIKFEVDFKELGKKEVFLNFKPISFKEVIGNYLLQKSFNTNKGYNPADFEEFRPFNFLSLTPFKEETPFLYQLLDSPLISDAKNIRSYKKTLEILNKALKEDKFLGDGLDLVNFLDEYEEFFYDQFSQYAAISLNFNNAYGLEQVSAMIKWETNYFQADNYFANMVEKDEPLFLEEWFPLIPNVQKFLKIDYYDSQELSDFEKLAYYNLHDSIGPLLVPLEETFLKNVKLMFTNQK